MAQKKRTKKKTKASARRNAAPKKKALKSKKKVARKPRKKLVKETPVPATELVQPTIQEDTSDIEERQEQVHDAEDAIVDEQEEEELGEAV
jgi:hypothetical protein